MDVPLAGTVTGRVRGLKTASIHGDLYYDVLLETEGVTAAAGMAAVLPLRVASHAWPAGGLAGARIEVTFLMRQVTGVRVV
ncbi:MAG: hypothetical protein ACT4PL_01980 [Phycisphaerales bacterium]